MQHLIQYFRVCYHQSIVLIKHIERFKMFHNPMNNERARNITRRQCAYQSQCAASTIYRVVGVWVRHRKISSGCIDNTAVYNLMP